MRVVVSFIKILLLFGICNHFIDFNFDILINKTRASYMTNMLISGLTC